MQKKRWRKVKHQKIPSKSQNEKIVSSSLLARFKAFVVDMFMIYIPILYITTYVILDGKEDFLSNQLAVFVDTFLFGLILSLFFAKSSQSPGFKAYELSLVDAKTHTKPSLLKAFFRYFCFLLSGASVLGLFVGFFRRDKKQLHDLLSSTYVKHV